MPQSGERAKHLKKKKKMSHRIRLENVVYVFILSFDLAYTKCGTFYRQEEDEEQVT